MDTSPHPYRTNRKRQIICLVSVILLTGIIVAFVHFRNRQRDLRAMKLQQIGLDLISWRQSKWLTQIGPELEAELSKFGKVTKWSYVINGDEPPPSGDGLATNRVVIAAEGGPMLTIRLKPAGGGKFDIIGFTTLPN